MADQPLGTIGVRLVFGAWGPSYVTRVDELDGSSTITTHRGPFLDTETVELQLENELVPQMGETFRDSMTGPVWGVVDVQRFYLFRRGQLARARIREDSFVLVRLVPVEQDSEKAGAGAPACTPTACSAVDERRVVGGATLEQLTGATEAISRALELLTQVEEFQRAPNRPDWWRQMQKTEGQDMRGAIAGLQHAAAVAAEHADELDAWITLGEYHERGLPEHRAAGAW
jgi:hypothetical protein